MHIYGTYRTRLRTVPMQPNARRTVLFEGHRFRCPCRQETVTELNPYRCPETRITKQAAVWIPSPARPGIYDYRSAEDNRHPLKHDSPSWRKSESTVWQPPPNALLTQADGRMQQQNHGCQTKCVWVQERQILFYLDSVPVFTYVWFGIPQKCVRNQVIA
mgnify:CR=1 FL=1